MHSTTLSHPTLPSAAVIDVLGADGFEIGPPSPRSRTVLDTFDGRLHAAGLRLEHRREPAEMLVLLGRDTDPPATLVWAEAAPRWPRELPPGPFRARLAAVTKERALLPVLTIASVARSARRADRRGKTVVLVDVHDHVTVAGHEGPLPSWVAEIVPVLGHADIAATVLDGLGATGIEADVGGLTTLVAHAAGVSLAGRTSSPSVPLEPGDDALVAYRRVLANLAATMADNLEGTIADIDSEFLHELRVAVRRTRSVLAQGKGVLPPEVRDRYRETFRWLGQLTTAPRDLDVYILGWDDYVSPLPAADAELLEPVRQELEARRQHAHRELSAALASDQTRELLDGWHRWLDGPGAASTDVVEIGPLVARRIRKLQRSLLRDGRAITPAAPAERLHELRKDAKKLRYMLECFGSVLAPKPRKAFVRELKALQDNLGEHQDAEVHLAQLRDLAHVLHQRGDVDADVLLAMGRLSDHLDRRRQQERDEFGSRFAAYDSKRNRRTLETLLRSAEGA